MCESILRNSSFNNNEVILRDSHELSAELPSESDSKLFRSLTSGEIRLAKTIFKNIINYDRVKIYCDHSHSSSQSKIITNTRNGEVLLSINEYKSDFSAGYTSYYDSVKYSHLFILAMTFVWQYYRHDSSFHDSTYVSSLWYSYTLDKACFIFYTMEQQAAIIADYWLLRTYDLTEYENFSNCKRDERFKINEGIELLKEYESILWMHI